MINPRSTTPLLIMACLALLSNAAASSQPNIVFILADDLGWNDIGYQNPDIISPNIDKLAKEGIILDQNYMQPICSPSRSALMTGVYPFRMGLQHLVILPMQPVCVPGNLTMIPQHLKTKGYKTHMVGKWHLGFCSWNCTPTYRGFDSFYGFYNSEEDYYNKTLKGGGYDFRDGKDVDSNANGNYSTYQYVDRIQKIINDHDAGSPLFLYLPFQSVHDPLEVPQKYYDMYPHIQDTNRRIYSGMVSALDEAVGEVVAALKAKGIYDNTLIVFTADNGGWITYSGNNYPLRGGKLTIFEGGTRAVSFVHGPMFNQTGVRYQGLMHVVDWLPTIAEAAGVDLPPSDIDGVSQWKALLNLSSPTPRNEVVYNLDDSPFAQQGKAAIRVGDYKLVDGFPGLYPSWYKPATVGDSNNEPSSLVSTDCPTTEEALAMEDFSNIAELLASDNKYLFNLKDDPTEHNNLYSQLPEVVKQLESRLSYHRGRMVPPNFPANDPKSDPKDWGGAWSPGWC